VYSRTGPVFKGKNQVSREGKGYGKAREIDGEEELLPRKKKCLPYRLEAKSGAPKGGRTRVEFSGRVPVSRQKPNEVLPKVSTECENRSRSPTRT